MFQLPYELLLGLRYTRAKRRNGFISFISFSSMIGIALGVTALIVVLSIMNGFQKELRDRILDMTPHMTLAEQGERLSDWPSLYAQVQSLPHVTGAAPNVSGQGMLSLNGRVKGVMVKGILPEFEPEVASLSEKMVTGEMASLADRDYNMIIGMELANALGVSIGDKITLVAPQGSVSPLGMMPRLKRFTISGLFEVGMHEYDAGLAFVHMADAQRVFKLGEQVSALQLRLDDMFLVNRVRQSVGVNVPKTLYVRDWTQQHANFFRAIEMEKRMMFIVLALIIMVAAFNIVSTMVMVVTDKQKDIAVLRTLGASPNSISMIFMIQGLVIGVIGALLGVAGGVALSWNIDVIIPFIEGLFGFEFFPPDVYYISSIPSDLHWDDVYTVASVAFVLTLLATLYPARRAAKTRPVEALRYD
ncbi:MAG: lipoprotein-releasing ABC transporter permease subunit [Hydrogenovibrio sp.]|uniref:lipoprotein-releasing ABC transporter permease subunit n=1 Tax=Hydrogenovibrio sp. TaxID=2065821 RepID=UPI0028702C77|nr:lipoprotein-releasing ABC transporter permease subunit [Hydrogenovibrio sp.]MDR9497732.1 lipoprotein-releasing ABC transporter permease subunit [Hydrogenovibrio sp.]